MGCNIFVGNLEMVRLFYALMTVSSDVFGVHECEATQCHRMWSTSLLHYGFVVPSVGETPVHC